MLISHKHKFIFIKTKKTAGSTIENMIVNNFFDPSVDICTGSKIDGTPRVNIGAKKPGEPDGHKPWDLVKNYVTPVEWTNYYKFTVERNPWDKVVSEFYWRTANDKQSDLTPYDNDVDNFKHYMDNGFGTRFVAPIDWHLYASKGTVMVDEIVEYKGLADQLVSMFNDKLNLPLTKEMVTGTRMKSGHRKKHYTELYKEQRLIDKVAAAYSHEIKYFNYMFGE